MIRHGYPVYGCDRSTNHGYGVCAYTDELDAHKERVGVGQHGKP